MKKFVFATMAAAFAACVQAEAPTNDETSRSWVLPKYEPYPGFQVAVAQVVAGQRLRTTSTVADTVPINVRRLWHCNDESVSVNVWLVSHHTGDHKTDLNEKNKGGGFVYTCDAWSIGYDRMINSNRGKATLISVIWSKKLDMGPVFLKGNVGYAKLNYGVPRYDIMLHTKTGVAFLGGGLTRWPRLTVNAAPVPKAAGKAYIFWFNYELMKFE